MFYEPVWLFHRADLSVEQLTDLAGLRIAIGRRGQRHPSPALQLLADNGIDRAEAELVPLAG